MKTKINDSYYLISIFVPEAGPPEIEQDPSEIQAYKLLDYHLAMQKKWPEIITYWGKFIEQEPTNGQAYFERSGSYYHSGKMDLAIKDLKSGCSLGTQEACQQLGKLGMAPI